MQRLFIIFSCLLALLGSLAGPARPAESVIVDRVVAVVNEEIITLSDLQRELAKRTDIKDDRVILEEMIDQKLLMAAAKRSGMDVSDKELDEAVDDIMKRNGMDAVQFSVALNREGLTLEQYRTELRQQMTLSRLVNKFVRTGLSVEEGEIRAYYDRNPQLFALPEEMRVRHLLVKVDAKATAAQIAAAQEKARSLRERLDRGEDFIRLIHDYSESPSAVQDGDLGFLQRGHAVAEIEDAATALRPGQYAGPVRAHDGFHIIRLEEIRTPLRPYERVKDEISKMLFEQKMENTYRSWLQTLRSDSHIENRL